MHNGLCIVFLAVTIIIGHTQKRLTADHKWIQCSGSTCRNGLEQTKFVAIPLENVGDGIIFTSRVVVGKGKECVTIDLKGFHIPCSITKSEEIVV